MPSEPIVRDGGFLGSRRSSPTGRAGLMTVSRLRRQASSSPLRHPLPPFPTFTRLRGLCIADGCALVGVAASRRGRCPRRRAQSPVCSRTLRCCRAWRGVRCHRLQQQQKRWRGPMRRLRLPVAATTLGCSASRHYGASASPLLPLPKC